MYDRVSEFGLIALDYASAQVLTVSVYVWTEGAARPGSATKTLTFPASTTRTTRSITLEDASPATPVEGSLIQVEINSTGIFKLFGGKVTHRPIPVYINGAATPSEPWISPILSIGGN